MSSIQDKYFECLSEAPCISLPKWLVDDAAAQGPQMGDFHVGCLLLEEGVDEAFKPLNVCHSKVHHEKMVAYVLGGDHVVLLFGRMGLTNFAPSPMGCVSCIEQLFMLHKACFAKGGPSGCPNFDESATKILLAKKPFQAKSAGRGVEGLDQAEWDRNSYKSMRASIQYACTDQATFERYQSFVTKCPPEAVKLIAEGKFSVYECNDDGIWGVGKFTKDVLLALAEIAKQDAGFDLKKAMTDIASGTKNQLGEVLTDFLLAIRGMTHAEYMQKLEGVTFFRVEEETVSATEEAVVVSATEEAESPAHKRHCT
jgi:predicted NAD-dependent protein-ADP-ribosyltransferase YbiA (DUF1768 family)